MTKYNKSIFADIEIADGVCYALIYLITCSENSTKNF